MPKCPSINDLEKRNEVIKEKPPESLKRAKLPITAPQLCELLLTLVF
ncbi:20400_t:CDS:2 [Rhizophagus irregularis]|nr:20400_t:CDS:2 [Rhizophagus irregularis]